MVVSASVDVGSSLFWSVSEIRMAKEGSIVEVSSTFSKYLRSPFSDALFVCSVDSSLQTMFVQKEIFMFPA